MIGNLRELFKKNLGAALRDNGWVHSVVAQRAGLSKQNFSAILNGPGNISLDTLEKISQAVSIAPERLLSPEFRVISRPPEAVSSQEKLAVAALKLDDASAALLLDLAKDFLTRRPEDAVRAAEHILSQSTTRKKKSP